MILSLKSMWGVQSILLNVYAFLCFCQFIFVVITSLRVANKIEWSRVLSYNTLKEWDCKHSDNLQIFNANNAILILWIFDFSFKLHHSFYWNQLKIRMTDCYFFFFFIIWSQFLFIFNTILQFISIYFVRIIS